MPACEYCWGMSRMLGIGYYEQMQRAENEQAPCTKDTIQGAMARAGQFWDEGNQRDKRSAAADRLEAPQQGQNQSGKVSQPK